MHAGAGLRRGALAAFGFSFEFPFGFYIQILYSNSNWILAASCGKLRHFALKIQGLFGQMKNGIRQLVLSYVVVIPRLRTAKLPSLYRVAVAFFHCDPFSCASA